MHTDRTTPATPLTGYTASPVASLGSTKHSHPGLTEALDKAFFVFSGMNGDKNLEINPSPTALKIAASMENMVAFTGGDSSRHSQKEWSSKGRNRYPC